MSAEGKVVSYALLDNASAPLGTSATRITPLVLNNIALLRLVPLLDKVEGVGVRLTELVYIVCELPGEYNPPLDDIFI